MGDPPSNPVQSTTFKPSKEQAELLKLAMPGFRSYAANPPVRYGGSQVAPFNASQLMGQEMVLNSVPSMQGVANQAGAANEFLLGDVLNPASNPHLQAYMDAAVRPINETLTRTALPAIRSGAEGTGNYGSSRQGVAEGIAIGDASRAVGDTSAKVANQGYLSGLEAMLKGLALAPTTQQIQAAPGVTTSGVGDVQQAREQAVLNEQVQGHYYDQLQDFMVSRDLASVLTGLPGGTNVSTANSPQPSGLAQAIGGASTAASILPQLFSFMSLSDRRMKHSLKQVGEYRGIPIYTFGYHGQKGTFFGMLADEVEKIIPSAVSFFVGDLKMVDYRKVL